MTADASALGAGRTEQQPGRLRSPFLLGIPTHCPLGSAIEYFSNDEIHLYSRALLPATP